MELDYTLSQFSLSQLQLKLLNKYYQNWEYKNELDLKFRYIKVFGIDMNTNKPTWISLHRKINKRRIPSSKLKESILLLFELNFIPIRIFQSVAEWLSPNEIEEKNRTQYLINTGIIVMENDDSLESSILTAQQIFKLNKKTIFVYSGNKSIHTWLLEINYKDFIRQADDEIWKRGNREKIDRQMRKMIYLDYQSKIDFEIDMRCAEDTRRVVPIIGSINAFTGRIVSSLSIDELQQSTANDIKNKYILQNWQD